MGKITILAIFSLSLLSFMVTSSFANEPNTIPWPVGSTEAMMNSTKTLMNSYGDPQNSWSSGSFHCGIDLDSWTEPPLGTTLVRCVHGAKEPAPCTVIMSHGPDLDFTSGRMQYSVVTTEGTGEFNHEDFGWCYEHLTNPEWTVTPDNNGWQLWEQIGEGELIASMHSDPNPYHTHFKWADWNFTNWCYVNPLDYLTPSATGLNYTWTFNPSGYTNTFESFFLDQAVPGEWPENPGAVNMRDENDLNGAIDVFFGFGLSGVGQTTTAQCGRNDLAPEKIKWNIQQVTVSGLELLVEKFLVNFNCPLNNQFNEKVQQLYFKFDLDEMYSYTSGEHEGLIVCLSNCGDMQDFDNIGIDNIDENAWQTNDNYLHSGETDNPVLAAFADGSYQLDVTLYTHDPSVTFPQSIPCELHNFAPALREVNITEATSDQTVYHGEWVRNDLSADLYVSVDINVEAGTTLDVVLTFTETMNTSSISACLGPLSFANGTWTSSVVLNDTWTGEVTMPSEGTDGFYILSVSATDTDGNSLMNPEGIGSIPDPPAPDTHHEIGMGFGVDLDWSVTLPEPIRGSIALDDIDGDGYMELAVQTEEGTVHIYNHDGSVLSGWPKSNTGYYPSYDEVHITPALGDVNNDGYIDVVSGYHCGSMAWNATGNTLSGWPFMVNGVEFEGQDFAYSSPVLCNLDSDDALEAVVCRQLYNLPSNGPPESVFALDSDGSEIWRCNLNPSNDGESVIGTPAVLDVTGDATPEILVCSSSSPTINKGTDDETDAWFCDGRLYLLSGSSGTILNSSSIIGEYVYGSPVVGDIDGDSSLEVVISCCQNPGGVVKSYVFSLPSLTLEHSWIIPGPLGSMSSATIGDIDNSGSVDVVVSGLNTVYAWDGITKQPLLGFDPPVNIGGCARHGISLADIDGDDFLEIVLCTTSGYLTALNHDGSNCGGFPIYIGNSMSQPAIDDIDGDGRLEICVTNTLGEIIVYEAGDSSWPALLTWPQYQHDARNSGILDADFNAPATPENFAGTGTLASNIFEADLSWTLSVNDPDHPTPTPPADVVSYRIYRTIPPGAQQLIATLPAGTSAYTDVVTFNSFPYPAAIVYHVSAWDGVNESPLSDRAKIRVGGLDNIAAGCPVREISHSAAVRSSRSHLSRAIGAVSSAIETAQRSNCRVLTDGEYNEVFISSGSSDFIEIDLGAVFSVNDVVMVGTDNSTSESPISDIPEPTHRVTNEIGASYQLSIDGRSFRSIDSGRARYIRIYNASGTAEVEVYGERVTVTSAAVDIQRSLDNGYRIAAVESGTPITATVFDLSGRSIWSNTSSTGEVMWNSCNSSGNTVPNGVYLIMVESDDIETFTSKVIVR